MPTVTSKDGTKIAYETTGSGPPLILIDGGMCYRAFGPMRDLANALTDQFTVIIYDRRGRGESGNTLPYAAGREVEDVVALIDGPGQGSVYLYGCSSGGAIAMETASAVPDKVTKVIVYEIPMIVDATRAPITPEHHASLDDNIRAGRNGAAVKQFLRMVEVPAFVVALMPLMMGKNWKTMESVAPTLPYDFAFVGDLQRGKPLPSTKWGDVTAKTLVADGGKSPTWMRNAQAALARIRQAEYRTLPGQTHMVKADAQAPMIKDFMGAA